MLVLEVSTDIYFRMLFNRLGPMEEARLLLVLHWNRGITTVIYYPNSILVHLSTVRHKSLELGLRNTMLCYNIIKVLPKYILNNCILSLLTAHHNRHDLTICGVIDVASHCDPMLDTLDVIEHDPYVFQISSRLHSFDQVHPGSGPHLWHLENKYLSLSIWQYHP